MRVLLIDQPKPLTKLLKRCLDEEGLNVDVSDCGEEASCKVRATDYDLILLDMHLPHEEAAALLRGWRKAGVAKPILALTSATTTAERVRCLDLGADDYLARPFQLVELVARVRALLRRAHRIYDPLIRVCDLEIDTSTRTVKRAGKPIRLTRREYALLQFLAFNRGRVVSRAMIWEHLYNEHDETTSNVVDVFIRYLRTKIDKGFDPPLILTRWGEGYLLRNDETELATTG